MSGEMSIEAEVNEQKPSLHAISHTASIVLHTSARSRALPSINALLTTGNSEFP